MKYYRALIPIPIQAVSDDDEIRDASDALFLRQVQPDWKP